MILLTWDEVSLEYRNGIVDAYEVNYSTPLRSTPVERVTQRSFNLTGSLELTTYSFSVRAIVTTVDDEDLFGPFDFVSIIHNCEFMRKLTLMSLYQKLKTVCRLILKMMFEFN